MKSYRLFNDPKSLKLLSANERKVLPILVEVAKKIDKIYELQENDKEEGANFYPKNVTRQNLEAEVKKSPQILSPYTVVEKDKSGKLITVPYHEKYARLLAPVADLLVKAASITKNPSFKKYLTTLAGSLMDGSYQKADIAWLKVKGSNLDLVAGPYETKLDKLFSIKKAYQAHVGIIDKDKSKSATDIRDILNENMGPRHHIVSLDKVDIQEQYDVISSGLLGKTLFAIQPLPTEEETQNKYGTKILTYHNVIDLKFEKMLYPIFTEIFAKNFKARYSKELLKVGMDYHRVLFSSAQQLHRYPDSYCRLKELFPIFEEANNMVSSVQHAKHLVLKGIINQKELESLMVIHICWIFSEWVIAKYNKTREDFLKGNSLVLYFLLKDGALREKDGISWPNFAKMFFEIENLAEIFGAFLEEGTYEEAQDFLKKYLWPDIFKAFDHRLRKIKPL